MKVIIAALTAMLLFYSCQDNLTAKDKIEKFKGTLNIKEDGLTDFKAEAENEAEMTETGNEIDTIITQFKPPNTLQKQFQPAAEVKKD